MSGSRSAGLHQNLFAFSQCSPELQLQAKLRRIHGPINAAHTIQGAESFQQPMAAITARRKRGQGLKSRLHWYHFETPFVCQALFCVFE